MSDIATKRNFENIMRLSSLRTLLDQSQFQGIGQAYLIKGILPHYLSNGNDSDFQLLSSRIELVKNNVKDSVILGYASKVQLEINNLKEKIKAEIERKQDIEAKIQETKDAVEAKEAEQNDLVDELCNIYSSKKELSMLEARVKKVDAQSGTIELKGRRDRAAARIYYDEQINKLTKDLKKKYRVTFSKSLCNTENTSGEEDVE